MTPAISPTDIAKSDLEFSLASSFDDVEADWKKLETKSVFSAFHSFFAMRVILATAAKQNEIVVATIRIKGETEPLAIFPFVKTRKNGLSVLTLIDEEVVDYGIAIIDSTRVGTESIELIMGLLSQRLHCDYLYFNKVPKTICGRDNSLAHAKNMRRLPLSSWCILPDGDYDKFAKQTHSKSIKVSTGRRRRKLSRETDRQFEIKIGEQVTDQNLDDFFEMRRNWARQKGWSDILASPDWQDAYRALAQSDRSSTQLWWARLSVNGRDIAMLAGLVFKEHLLALFPATNDNEWDNYAPGIQLFDETMRYFFGAGYSFYDFSIGDLSYKAGFGATCNPLFDAVYPCSLPGRIYFQFWKIKAYLRNDPKVRRLLAHVRK